MLIEFDSRLGRIHLGLGCSYILTVGSILVAVISIQCICQLGFLQRQIVLCLGNPVLGGRTFELLGLENQLPSTPPLFHRTPSNLGLRNLAGVLQIFHVIGRLIIRLLRTPQIDHRLRQVLICGIQHIL